MPSLSMLKFNQKMQQEMPSKLTYSHSWSDSTVLRNKWLYLGIFIILFNSVFVFTGRYKGGFGPMDDHEILAIPYRIQQSSLPATIVGWIKDDLDLRFRPSYGIYRVVSSWFFQGDSRVASIWTVIMGNLFGILLFLFFIWRKVHPGLALLLTTTCCIGPQIECWYLLGCQENIALLSLSIVLWLIKRVVENGTWVNELFLFLATVWMTGCKESFIIIVPAMLLYRLYLDRELHPHQSIFSLVKQKRYWMLASIILIIIEIGIISFLIPKLYSSDVSVRYNKIVALGVNSLYTLSVGLGELLFITLGLLTTLSIDNRSYRKSLLFLLAFVVLGAGGQIVGYKFIHDRYMLPCIFFYIMAIMEVIHLIPDIQTILESKKGKRFLNMCYIIYLVIAILLLVTYNLSIANGKTLNDFLPNPVWGLILSLVLLAYLVMYLLRGGKKYGVYSLVIVYICLRGNMAYAYQYGEKYMEEISRWEKCVNTLVEMQPSCLLIVSNPMDPVGPEPPVYMHSLFKFKYDINTKWNMNGFEKKSVENISQEWGWGVFHQGRSLTDDIVADEELGNEEWDTCFVFDRLKTGLSHKMQARLEMGRCMYIDSEHTMAILSR